MAVGSTPRMGVLAPPCVGAPFFLSDKRTAPVRKRRFPMQQPTNRTKPLDIILNIVAFLILFGILSFFLTGHDSVINRFFPVNKYVADFGRFLVNHFDPPDNAEVHRPLATTNPSDASERAVRVFDALWAPLIAPVLVALISALLLHYLKLKRPSSESPQ
jgi:hypothetical protein